MDKQHSTKSQGRSLNKLTSTEVKAAKRKDKVFTLADGGGLGLVVKPSGGRYWQFRYRDTGRAAVASFGTFPDVSLALLAVAQRMDSGRYSARGRTSLMCTTKTRLKCNWLTLEAAR